MDDLDLYVSGKRDALIEVLAVALVDRPTIAIEVAARKLISLCPKNTLARQVLDKLASGDGETGPKNQVS